ncbi:MAG: hypothetical protein KC912_14145 [Proteobacteria bacterium]|nr:hypothetical protein [Pseudomonadota bacterium]
MPPNRRLALLLCALALFVFGFLVRTLGSVGPAWVTVVFDERSPVAWLTSVLLASAAVAAASAALHAARPRPLSLVAVLALAAGLDEWFMGHERLKEALLFGPFEGDIEAMGILGDLPLAVAGLVMLAALVPLFREPPHPWVRPLLGAFVALSACALTLDLFAPIDPWHAVEEVIECVAAALVFAGMLCSGARPQVQALADT